MDILELLKKNGLSIPDDKLDEFNKEFRTAYKSSAEVQKIKNELTSTKNSLADAQTAIQGYTDSDLEGKLKALQSKYDADIAAKQKELDDMVFNTKLDAQLKGIEFSSSRVKDSVLAEIKNKGFKVNKEGKLDGLDSYLKELYTNEPSTFANVDNSIHTWAGGSDNKQNQQVKNYNDIFNRIH